MGPEHSTAAKRRRSARGARARPDPVLPRSLFSYVLDSSSLHQAALVLMSVAAFLLELVPLELQRRIVNDLVKHRQFSLVVTLCAAYAGAVLLQGGIKAALNIYRGWVGERATRDLRRRIRGVVERSAGTLGPAADGIEVSMVVAEVEPIGGFVGESISEPLLQGGVLASVLAYMVHLDPLMTTAALAIFTPQLIFVPLMQGAINRRTSRRVQLLREVGINIIAPDSADGRRTRADEARIDRVFMLNMGIFKLKFTMNYLMNLCNHLQIVSALLIGGWAVYEDQLEIGGVVAFISAISRLNDPWGDLVNYLRDVSNTQVKFRLVADATNRLALGMPPRSAAT
jgi:ABC-type multidrug transport system fused ATPase/permease subunit